jgi:hypothetical protein
MAAAEDAGGGAPTPADVERQKRQERRNRRFGVVLVQIEGFPLVDPGRRLVFDVRSSESRARKMVARMAVRMPEHRWSHEMMKSEDIKRLRRAPFISPEAGMRVSLHDARSVSVGS